MIEEGYTKLCRFDELKEREGRRFIVDDPDRSGQVIEIAVFKFGDEIFALSNICPHQHTSLIYDGFIEDDCVVCPVHCWKFDLRTGRKSDGHKGLDSFPVKVINDELFIKVYKKELKW